MKPYLPVAIAAGLVIVGLVAALFLTPALAPPEARLQDEIADDIARAQAMLASYSPTDAALLRQFDAAATTQPSTADQPANDLDPQVKSALEARKNLIADAEQVIQSAVQKQVGDVSGDSSPAATRLQTLILVEKAQVDRREGGLHWRLAADTRTRVRDLLANWNDVDAQVRSLESTLSGQGALPDRATAGPAAEPVAPTEPSAPKEHSRVGTLLGKLLGGKKETAAPEATPPVAAAPSPAEPAEAPAETRPATAQARPSGPPACTLSTPVDEVLARQTQSPQQRITDLRLCRTQVEERLSRAQQEADALAPRVEVLHRRIDAAKARAADAQKKMLALERAGVDATQPGSLDQFTKEYTDASTAYRRALRTISILTAGSSNTPKLTPDEQEMLLDPAIQVDPDVETEQRGVTALEGDLAAARTLVETQKQLLSQIDRSIERLTKSEAQSKEYLATLKAGRDRVAEELAVAAKEAVSQAVAAYNDEERALDVLKSEAPAAAGRAQRAVSGPGDRASTAGAKALDGDIEAARAMVLAQRAVGLEKHAWMLERLEPVAIPPAGLEPGSGEGAPGPWATQAGAAMAAAQASRDEASKAANEAIGAYSEAANSANQLWTIHTEIAAMHYLLGNLSTGEAAEKHFADARKSYDLATRDRRDRPEVQPLRAVYEKLAQAN